MSFKDPERKDLASASKFASYAACHIKFQLEFLAPQEKAGKDAEKGTRGHEVLATNNLAGLSLDELDTVQLAKERENALISSLIGDTARKEIREKRLFYSESGEPLFTGMPDVIYIPYDEDKTAVILDYKLGLLPVQPSGVNLQLRALAVLAWQNYGVRRVYVSIIQPNGGHWYTPALYELDDLQAARQEIKELMAAIHSPDAVANPSAEACRHCSAKLICKAAYDPSLAIAARSKDVVVQMSDADLSMFGELAEQAQLIITAAKAELKERVTARPDDFPGWYLQSTGSTSWVEDPQEAYGRFKDLLSAKEFADICKPSIKGLTDLMRTTTGLSKVLARQEVEKRLGELLIKEAKAPSLKRRATWEVEIQ